MIKSYQVRRGPKNNILDIKRTYTIWIELDEIDQEWEDDEVKLISENSDYEQIKTLGADGYILEDRWIVITFTGIRSGEYYSCFRHPREMGALSEPLTVSTASSKASVSDNGRINDEMDFTAESANTEVFLSGMEEMIEPLEQSARLLDSANESGWSVMFQDILLIGHHLNKPQKPDEGYYDGDEVAVTAKNYGKKGDKIEQEEDFSEDVYFESLSRETLLNGSATWMTAISVDNGDPQELNPGDLADFDMSDFEKILEEQETLVPYKSILDDQIEQEMEVLLNESDSD